LGAAKVRNADNADLRFSRFADAAFSRSRGTFVFATQRVPPIRSFMVIVLAATETVLSLQAGQKSKTLTLLPSNLIKRRTTTTAC
jgi:hypothetical protein